MFWRRYLFDKCIMNVSRKAVTEVSSTVPEAGSFTRIALVGTVGSLPDSLQQNVLPSWRSSLIRINPPSQAKDLVLSCMCAGVLERTFLNFEKINFSCEYLITLKIYGILMI